MPAFPPSHWQPGCPSPGRVRQPGTRPSARDGVSLRLLLLLEMRLRLSTLSSGAFSSYFARMTTLRCVPAMGSPVLGAARRLATNTADPASGPE